MALIVCAKLGPSTKKLRLVEDARKFQKRWTEQYGVIAKNNKALCILCLKTAVCRTSSVRTHFESVHNELNTKTEEEKKELVVHSAKRESKLVTIRISSRDCPVLT